MWKQKGIGSCIAVIPYLRLQVPVLLILRGDEVTGDKDPASVVTHPRSV